MTDRDALRYVLTREKWECTITNEVECWKQRGGSGIAIWFRCDGKVAIYTSVWTHGGYLVCQTSDYGAIRFLEDVLDD